MKNIITTLAIFIILFAVLEKDVFSADTWTFTESPIKTIHTYNTETECNVERNKFLAKPLRQDAGPCVLQKTPEIPKNITTGTTQTTTTTTNNPKASTTGTTQTTTTTTNNPKASTTGTTQTTTTQDSITKYWSYYRSDKKDLSGEVFMDEASCMNASSNNPFADKSRFDTTWQNCFISDKNGKPLEEDTYYFQDTDNGIIQVNPRVAKSKPSWEKYTLLAPFAGFNEAPENVGDYLNKIFVIGIALCGALAVVMLVVAGILYMGEESIFGKTKWREQMKNALFGLLIALSAYALLNTIDPRLLGGGGVNIRAVTIELDPEIHGDSPHAPRNGKYCGGKYKPNDPWPKDDKERAKLAEYGIKIKENRSCEYVGQSDCTSVAGLDTSKVIAFKKACGSSCNLVITGGTECWLHSYGTQHLPGNAIVDLRTSGVSQYIEKDSKVDVVSKWGKETNIHMYTKNGAEFVKEEVNPHYHVKKW